MYLLRLLLIAITTALFCELIIKVAYADWYTDDGPFPLLLIILFGIYLWARNILSGFVLCWMLNILDLVLSGAEIGLAFYLLHPWSTSPIASSQADQYILVQLSVWTILITACLLFALRVLALGLRCKEEGAWRSLVAPFDLLYHPSRRGSTRFNERIHVIVGFSIWKRFFKCEPRSIVISRGITGIIFMTIILAYGIKAILLDPLRESTRIPVREYHWGLDVMAPDVYVKSDVAWRIIIYGSEETLSAAVNVTPITYNNTQESHCSGPEAGEFENKSLVEVNCTTFLGFNKTIEHLPELLISVDMTKLRYPNGSTLQRPHTLSIVFGLSESLTRTEIIRDMIPITLRPGDRLSGGVTNYFKQTVEPGAVGALGFSVFSKTKNYWVGKIDALRTDNTSPDIPVTNTSASLRLYGLADFSKRILQIEYHEKTIWEGISAIGGAWTTINGVFIVIFGTGILMLAFGIKPLSAFGLVHELRKMDISDEYPNLTTEGANEPGMVAYIRDHFVDVYPVQLALEKKQEGRRTSEDSGYEHKPSNETESVLLEARSTADSAEHTMGSRRSLDIEQGLGQSR